MKNQRRMEAIAKVWLAALLLAGLVINASMDARPTAKAVESKTVQVAHKPPFDVPPPPPAQTRLAQAPQAPVILEVPVEAKIVPKSQPTPARAAIKRITFSDFQGRPVDVKDGPLMVNPPECDEYTPITAGCNCIIPTGTDADIKITWTLDEHCKGIASADNKQMYLWSPPGDHEISVTVEVKYYETVALLVVDVKDPDNKEKWKIERKRLMLDMSKDTYSATFKVNSLVPPTPPTPPPAPELQSAVAGVRNVMQIADKKKAATFASAWSDFLVALKSGTPPKTNGEFRNAVTQFLNAAVAKANLQGAFPGFSNALNDAMTKVFTDQDGSIDAQKAADFTAAIVWACTPAKK